MKRWLGPKGVFLVACALVLFSFVFDGTLFKIYSLQEQITDLNERIEKTEYESKELSQKLLRLSHPGFLESQARDRLDMTSEDDLIFVFTDEGREDVAHQ